MTGSAAALERSKTPPWRNPWVLAFFAGVAMVHIVRPLMRHVPEPPPRLFRLDPFQLVDRRGETFGSAQLAGSVYVANFFFSSCTNICPPLMAAVGRLRARYDREGLPIEVVSISVDPTHDRPEVLRDYAERLGAPAAGWHFLTGTAESVEAVARSFRVAVEGIAGAGEVDITHSGRLILVDGEGWVRGLYDAGPEGLDEVFHRSLHVLHEAAR